MSKSIKELLKRFGHAVRFTEIPGEIRQKIHQLCADFIGGPWDRTMADQLNITHLRGGTSNMLFLCSLPSKLKEPVLPRYPSQLLLRVYFNPNTANHIVEESVVFTLLSERNMGPKLFGVFPDGRLEEFVKSRSLATNEIRIPAVSARLGHVLAQIHRMTVPLGKKPVYLAESMHGWMAELRKLHADKPLEVTLNDETQSKLTLDKLDEEVHTIIRCIEKSPSPIVFSHNDFQEGNILLKSTDIDVRDGEFCIIDYEYASYNYRGFDVANHFCEWTFDYHSNQEHPFFYWTQEFFPDAEQQMNFLKNYLDELNASPKSIPAEHINNFVEEVASFVPVSHFFWGLWALLLEQTSPVQFGYRVNNITDVRYKGVKARQFIAIPGYDHECFHLPMCLDVARKTCRTLITRHDFYSLY